ncbi:MAG: hypothetical protein EOM26_09710 [Alphaproteobacteria bacterium]|nr:hypothetical protein [Alphaproteobacteria bacterium]
MDQQNDSGDQDETGGGSVSGKPPGDDSYSQDRQREDAEADAEERARADADRRVLDDMRRRFRENAETFGRTGPREHRLGDGSVLKETADSFDFDKRPTDQQLELIVERAVEKGWPALYARKKNGGHDGETAARLQAIVTRKGLGDRLAVSLDGRPVDPPLVQRVKARAAAAAAGAAPPTPGPE